METSNLLNKITETIDSIKGLDTKSINVEAVSSFADYIVVCHGTSTTHVKGISDNVEMALKKDGVYPLGIEGYNEAQWILLDYNTVILHIFLGHVRDDYKLEDLYTATSSTRSD